MIIGLTAITLTMRTMKHFFFLASHLNSKQGRDNAVFTNMNKQDLSGGFEEIDFSYFFLCTL